MINEDVLISARVNGSQRRLAIGKVSPHDVQMLQMKRLGVLHDADKTAQKSRLQVLYAKLRRSTTKDRQPSTTHEIAGSRSVSVSLCATGRRV